MPPSNRQVTTLKFERTTLKKEPRGVLEKVKGQIIHENSTKFFPFIGYLYSIPKNSNSIRLYYSSSALTTSTFAQQIHAKAVINGGFWDKEKRPLDWCAIDGNTITKLHNLNRPCIYWPRDGNNQIEIDDPNPIHLYSAVLQSGPLLLKNGEIQFDFSDFVINAVEFDSDITADRHPRTIFGYNDESYFFLVVDGRSLKTAGLYLEECAQLVQLLGFRDAINLDGGASSTLVVGGKRINEPRFSFIRGSCIFSARIPGKERAIPTFLYVI